MQDGIKISAKTYDEAITKALIELQTTSEHLDVEVIDEGSEGLFGMIGGKPCIIMARIKSDDEISMEANDIKEDIDTDESADEDIISSEDSKEDDEASEDKKAYKKAQGIEESTDNVAKIKREYTDDEVAQISQRGADFLKELLSAMGEDITLETEFDHSENELDISLTGDDMGRLIGKRGQTLDSIQYLTSLVVNKKSEEYIRVKVDTENYRERRKAKLEQLAHNMAKKVSRTGREVVLEPMNPYERRIIHSALQANRYVTTRSEGEDPYRHIIIMLK